MCKCHNQMNFPEWNSSYFDIYFIYPRSPFNNMPALFIWYHDAEKTTCLIWTIIYLGIYIYMHHSAMAINYLLRYIHIYAYASLGLGEQMVRHDWYNVPIYYEVFQIMSHQPQMELEDCGQESTCISSNNKTGQSKNMSELATREKTCIRVISTAWWIFASTIIRFILKSWRVHLPGHCHGCHSCHAIYIYIYIYIYICVCVCVYIKQNTDSNTCVITDLCNDKFNARTTAPCNLSYWL